MPIILFQNHNFLKQGYLMGQISQQANLSACEFIGEPIWWEIK